MGSAEKRKGGGAAARVRAKFAAREARLATAADAAEKAWVERGQALAAVESAEDRFREAVAALVAEDQSLEEAAELAQVPIEAVRAARRPKRTADAGGESARDAGPADTSKEEQDRGIDYGLPGAQLRREAEASVALDGETHVVGAPVPAG
jgi:hypothetical protein